MGIVNVNDISDFSFSMEELGGKKAYMKNISQRKGLPKVRARLVVSGGAGAVVAGAVLPVLSLLVLLLDVHWCSCLISPVPSTVVSEHCRTARPHSASRSHSCLRVLG